MATGGAMSVCRRAIPAITPGTGLRFLMSRCACLDKGDIKSVSLLSKA
jgi:hypothetical protein